jgi:hypothetical protein
MYQALPLSRNVEMHEHADGLVETMSSNGFVRSESMDIKNDPRFFTANVIDKRLAAVSGLSVVSTLMVGIALGECYNMKKDIDLANSDGLLEFAGFGCMNIVLFLNLLAAYIGVAQVYFTYRLMTAGATGFEMAASFYLNPNIAFWRHAGVKGMLNSLPLFLFGGAFRMLVKFDTDMPHVGGEASKDTSDTAVLPWWQARIYGVSLLGVIVCGLYLITALFLAHINSKHSAVFKERYASAKRVETPIVNFQTMSMSNRSLFPDI